MLSGLLLYDPPLLQLRCTWSAGTLARLCFCHFSVITGHPHTTPLVTDSSAITSATFHGTRGTIYVRMPNTTCMGLLGYNVGEFSFHVSFSALPFIMANSNRKRKSSEDKKSLVEKPSGSLNTNIKRGDWKAKDLIPASITKHHCRCCPSASASRPLDFQHIYDISMPARRVININFTAY